MPDMFKIRSWMALWFFAAYSISSTPCVVGAEGRDSFKPASSVQLKCTCLSIVPTIESSEDGNRNGHPFTQQLMWASTLMTAYASRKHTLYLSGVLLLILEQEKK
jgi:hypothetical protein